jgi:outer membrane protein TolC
LNKTILFALLCSTPAWAVENTYPDLPPLNQVEAALESHLNVRLAERGILWEQGNQRRLESGPYEFNIRAGSAQRRIINNGQNLKEWDIALERPIRLFNKSSLDSRIGAESVNRARYALGDAQHEAARQLLKLWFVWQREETQNQLWQKQTELLNQLTQLTEKRVNAGDAPKMELNQARAIAAQAIVSQQQAALRSKLAAGELIKQFPGLTIPQQTTLIAPQPINHDLAYWRAHALEHNHELGMIQAESLVQSLHAQRARADRLPDPTLGIRHSNEMGGNERVTGLYLTVPFPGSARSALADSAEQQSGMATERAEFVKRRIEDDIRATHLQASVSYDTWQQAHAAGENMRQNAELATRAYGLGENSLGDTLTARRLALESTLAENLAQLDANEARYRLLLDAHELWPIDAHDESESHEHY